MPLELLFLFSLQVVIKPTFSMTLAAPLLVNLSVPKTATAKLNTTTEEQRNSLVTSISVVWGCHHRGWGKAKAAEKNQKKSSSPERNSPHWSPKQWHDEHTFSLKKHTVQDPMYRITWNREKIRATQTTRTQSNFNPALRTELQLSALPPLAYPSTPLHFCYFKLLSTEPQPWSSTQRWGNQLNFRDSNLKTQKVAELLLTDTFVTELTHINLYVNIPRCLQTNRIAHLLLFYTTQHSYTTVLQDSR